MMEEVVTLRLENEMDLLLANRRAMKLAELCGQSLTFQTVLATAVSEVARASISIGKDTRLKLGITPFPQGKKKITAVLCNTVEACGNSEAFRFAKRLVPETQIIKGTGSSYDVQLDLEIKYGALVTDSKIASFIEYFKTELPISPYDEIRRKSIQVLEFSRKVEESEAQYRQLTDTLPLMMFVANPTGQVVYTNKWLRDYLGDSLTAIAPSSFHGVTHPDDQTSFSKDLHVAFSSGQAFNAEARLSSKRGSEHLWHLISIQPVKSELNVIIQWTGFIVDINAQKTVSATLKDNADLNRARESMASYQRQLEEKIAELNTSNSDLEQFAYIASHDLQEPLRKIATFSALLQGNLRDLDDLSQMYFHRIISSSVRMTDQIKDVLEWSALSKSAEAFGPVDLNSIIESVKTDLELMIKEKRAVIQSSDLPIVLGSRLQLIRLFSNLVGNALKFCNSGPIVTISSRALANGRAEQLKKFDPSVSYAEVNVSDNGVGFKQEHAERIFRIFQRLHGQHEYRGTGIGLAICKKIAENHRGDIYATSNPGQGATFTIVLPITQKN
jgi:hypothetical protein